MVPHRKRKGKLEKRKEPKEIFAKVKGYGKDKLLHKSILNSNKVDFGSIDPVILSTYCYLSMF